MAHSAYGFSGQSRSLACAGSVQMSANQPSETNAAAELGTAVHELSEAALKLGLSCGDFIGSTFNDHETTQEMADAGDVYVNYVRQLMLQRPNAQLLLEQKVCITSISDDLWGTSDCIIINGDELIVGDYKNGYGLVEVNADQYIHAGDYHLQGNAQAIGYMLATMDTYQLWGRITKWKIFVVQPNADHVDGVIRSFDITNELLMQWHTAYRDGHLANKGDIVLNAGNHCRYCKARGFCGERIQTMMRMLGLSQPVIKLTEEQIFEIYREANTLKKTIEAIEEQATLIARKGLKTKDYKLVKAIVRWQCNDEGKFIQAVQESIPDAELFNKRLKSKTQLDKVVGKDLVSQHFSKPEAGTVLVPITDKRPAIMPDMRPDATGKFGSVES